MRGSSLSKRKPGVAPPKGADSKRRAADGRPGPLAVDRQPAAGNRRGLATRWAAAGAALLGVGGVLLALAHRAHTPASPIAVTSPTAALSPAEQALRAAVTRLPRDPDAHRALARYLLDQHRPFEALWHFRAAQDLGIADSATAVAAARALTQAGLPLRAVSLLRDRLARAPADLDSRCALAEAYLAVARPQEAATALIEAGSALATSAPGQLLLGDGRAAIEDVTGAQAAYRRAVTLEPEEAVGHDRSGRLAFASGQWKAAQQEFTAARERKAGDRALGYRLGQAYWGAGGREEAERLWEEVAASSPSYAPVQVALGEAYQSRQDLSGAAVHLTAAVSADPASKEAQFTLAKVMTAQGARASAFYQRGLYYLETDRP